jgi:hypothetical protein
VSQGCKTAVGAERTPVARRTPVAGRTRVSIVAAMLRRMRQQARCAHRMPVLTWLGNRVRRSRLVLIPQRSPCRFRFLGRPIDALFFRARRVLHDHHASFARADSGACGTPGAYVVTGGACLIQHLPTRVGGDVRQIDCVKGATEHLIRFAASPRPEYAPVMHS